MIDKGGKMELEKLKQSEYEIIKQFLKRCKPSEVLAMQAEAKAEIDLDKYQVVNSFQILEKEWYIFHFLVHPPCL